MDNDFGRLIDDALALVWQRDPVAATFAGETGVDGVLARADAAAEAHECRALDVLAARLAGMTIPNNAAARIDARHLDAYCALARSDAARRARYRNPAWYTGEAAFAVISLLLRAAEPQSSAALTARIRAIPDFLADGGERLRGLPIPAAWVGRAQTELGALARLMRDALPLHPLGAAVDPADAAAVCDAAVRFAALIAKAAEADPACGSEHFAFILKRVHGLTQTPAELERHAAAAFDRVRDALEAHARALDSAMSWREQLTRLADIGPDCSDVVAPYRRWHERALDGARDLLTPADDYSLEFEPLPPWARPIAADLYFLFYRSPAAHRAGRGSMYWIAPPNGSPAEMQRAHNTATVKLIHAVHHGSVGHHTQNARARSAASRFARIAGTDGASSTALLSCGTMVEGWACYAEDLMAEVPNFYTPQERLQLIYFELRNIASCLADIRFHTGAYTLEAMRTYYRDDAAFAPTRIGAETTRNSMFPGSRVMYWCGSQQISALHRASLLPAKTFHDRLLSYGSTPVAWVAAEMAR